MTDAVNDQLRAKIVAEWDARAARFDDEPDHGLRSVVTRAAWWRRLSAWLPEPAARVADLGCGTGSIAVLLASKGYDVAACDLSAEMIEHARAKAVAADVFVDLRVADAASPPLDSGSCDVVFVRHLAWTLPQPVAAIETWAGLLRTGGRLVMVEGRWTSAGDGERARDDALLPWNGGVPAATLVPVLEERFDRVEHHDLAHDDDLWGRGVSDERFAVVARSLG